MSDTPAEASELLAALEQAIESIEVAMMDGIEGSHSERIRLYAYVRALNGHQSRSLSIADALEESVIADLDEPVDVDGERWSTFRQPSRSGFDKAELRKIVTGWARSDVVDPETGEFVKPTVDQIVERIWVLAEPATGRTARFREDAGVDLDEYSVVRWRTRLGSDPIPPDEIEIGARP